TKYTQSGMAICTMAVAVNNPRKDKNGEWHNDTLFIDCTAFDKNAEKASGFSKGQQVCIEGKLKQENWEKDGQKRSKILITVSSVKPFETARKGEYGDSEGTGNSNASDNLDWGPVNDSDVPF